MVIAMLRLSVNILWSLQYLLKKIEENNLHRIKEIYFINISAANIDALIELAKTCEWINVDESEVKVNKKGYDIIDAGNFKSQIRKILVDYIVKVNPIWSKRIPYGRKEAFIFMNKDEQACFSEAGLMKDDLDIDDIKWWDQLANYIRSQDNLHKDEIGRKGEWYTVLYEEDRVGKKPQWVAIESNLSGYDIISCVSRNNISDLLIEVKASEQCIKSAEFYITANEWNIACNADNYFFYLWSFYNSKKWLAVIKPINIMPYIPTNNKTGEWEKVKIPFESFEKEFEEINLGGKNGEY